MILSKSKMYCYSFGVTTAEICALYRKRGKHGLIKGARPCCMAMSLIGDLSFCGSTITRNYYFKWRYNSLQR